MFPLEIPDVTLFAGGCGKQFNYPGIGAMEMTSFPDNLLEFCYQLACIIGKQTHIQTF